jgi:MATE family multidrug resistance protein
MTLSRTSVSRGPLGELLFLALPTVAQMASYTVMQFIDTWMLAQLGSAEPTAASNAGMIAFSLISFGFGVLMIVNTLVSQNFGQRDYANCGRYLWQGIWFALAYSILLLPLIPVAPRLFGFLGHGRSMVGLETKYLQIVIGMTLFKMVGTALGQFLLATNRPNAVLVSTVLGVAANVVVAWVLIFGHFGMPSLGVVGAAWAQNVGVFVEMLVLIVFVLWPGAGRVFNVLDWRIRAEQMRTLVTIGAGSGLQISADVFAWSLFSAGVMAQLGDDAMAAGVFMFRYMVVSFMPAFGLSQAVTALVGRYIGMKRPEEAEKRANLGFVVAACYMVSCGLVYFVFRRQLINVFNPSPDVLAMGMTLMIFAGIYQFFDAMYIIYNGALRGAGDTAVPAFVTAGFCWGITVGLGFVVARYLPQFGVAGPWTCATIYGIILGIFMLARFKRGAWKGIHLEADEQRGFEVVPTTAQLEA